MFIIFCALYLLTSLKESDVIVSDFFFSPNRKNNVPERLEVDPSKNTTLDLANIVPRQSTREGPLETSRTTPPAATGRSSFSEGFVDDPDVPPLI